jgi:hypothetical protein
MGGGGGSTLSSVVVVLLICLVLVVVAIVVVIRLLLAELARSAAYRQPVTRGPVPDPQPAVNRSSSKNPVRPTVAAGPPLGTPSRTEYVDEGGLLVETPERPRAREVRQVTHVYWWRRLRSGTALFALVAVLGVATAATIGAIVLVLALIVEQAIK